MTKIKVKTQFLVEATFEIDDEEILEYAKEFEYSPVDLKDPDIYTEILNGFINDEYYPNQYYSDYSGSNSYVRMHKSLSSEVDYYIVLDSVVSEIITE